MIWNIPKIWEDGEVWIIGGGASFAREFSVPEEVIDQVTRKRGSPSLYSPYMKAIHDKHILGINMAFTLGDWVDVVLYGDNPFYLQHRGRLAEFPGIKLSCHPRHNGRLYEKENIKCILRDTSKRYGLSDKPNSVIWNGNTGGAGIDLAVHMGAKRIILLGFDMKLMEKDRQHFHSYYNSAHRPVDAKRLMSLPFDKHLLCFPEIAKDARKKGVEIINASPESNIKDFKKVSVKDLI